MVTNKKQIHEKNGDEKMGNVNVIYPKLDLSLILGKGTQISSHEALQDAVVINWGKDVLNGKHKDTSIIKSKENEDK
ncbi:MAG: hypothetical protein UHN47_03410 [Lachnospiraceae bacterium]|nr:hypothetical protein [Lachnospiraceae bacterium]